MKHLIIIFFLGLSSTTHTISAYTLEELLPLTEAQLDEIYHNGYVGEIPSGESKGEPLFFPGKEGNTKAAKIALKVWTGKIFDPVNGTVYNRVFGKELVPGKLFYGDSWFDSGRAIIIDYQETAKVMSRVRDELREISPGFLLGRAHIRKSNGNRFWIYFALDFNK